MRLYPFRGITAAEGEPCTLQMSSCGEVYGRGWSEWVAYARARSGWSLTAGHRKRPTARCASGPWSRHSGHASRRSARHACADASPITPSGVSHVGSHLGPNDSIKAALIQVCKHWNMGCKSDRGDSDNPSTEYSFIRSAWSTQVILGAASSAFEQQMG
jgi:hypothetical protein